MAIQIGRLIKRYCLVTLFPAFVVSTIYADWSFTQKCKARDAKTIELGKEDVFGYS